MNAVEEANKLVAEIESLRSGPVPELLLPFHAWSAAVIRRSHAARVLFLEEA